MHEQKHRSFLISKFPIVCRALSSVILLVGAFPGMAMAFQLGGGGGFVIFGRVSMPDGQPAARVVVQIEGGRGLHNDTRTDEQGRYEFMTIPGGRYHLKASHPGDETLYTDSAEADTSRAGSNRLQVPLFFRRTEKPRPKVNPGTVNAAEASQNIPSRARKAFEDGLRLGKEKKIEEALKSFNEAIELYPGYFQALTERGNLLLQRNQLMEAATDYDRALKITDKYAPALRGMGLCLLQSQHLAEAAEALSRAATIEPDEATTHMFLGFAQLGLRQHHLAEASLQKALKLDTVRAVRARAYLADLYASENRFAEAVSELQAYLAAQPNTPDAARLKAMEAEWRAKAAKK